MSPQWIEVDGEVIALIKAHAEPFVDSPDAVLRRLLGLKAGSVPRCSQTPADLPPKTQARAGAGELLPMAEYRLPLLRAISRAGGSAGRKQVIDAVEKMLADKLTDLDRARLGSGEVRWCNRLGFARRRLIEQGQLRADSPRGVWELAEAGIEELGRLEAIADEERRGTR
jgi:hypothetical protein